VKGNAYPSVDRPRRSVIKFLENMPDLPTLPARLGERQESQLSKNSKGFRQSYCQKPEAEYHDLN
jgi:hypothetical protein